MFDSLIHRATIAAVVCALLAACGNRADSQQGYQPPVKQEATLSRSTFQQHIQVQLKGTPYFAAQTVLPLNADQHKFYSFQVALPLAVPAWGESDFYLSTIIQAGDKKSSELEIRTYKFLVPVGESYTRAILDSRSTATVSADCANKRVLFADNTAYSTDDFTTPTNRGGDDVWTDISAKTADGLTEAQEFLREMQIRTFDALCGIAQPVDHTDVVQIDVGEQHAPAPAVAAVEPVPASAPAPTPDAASVVRPESAMKPDADSEAETANDREQEAPAPAAATPSFDCAKVLSNVEKMICGNPKLAKADADLSSVYRRVTQHMTGDQLNSVRTAERGFIKQRNQCQAEDCVAGAYQIRLAQLQPLISGQ